MEAKSKKTKNKKTTKKNNKKQNLKHIVNLLHELQLLVHLRCRYVHRGCVLNSIFF